MKKRLLSLLLVLVMVLGMLPTVTAVDVETTDPYAGVSYSLTTEQKMEDGQDYLYVTVNQTGTAADLLVWDTTLTYDAAYLEPDASKSTVAATTLEYAEFVKKEDNAGNNIVTCGLVETADRYKFNVAEGVCASFAFKVLKSGQTTVTPVVTISGTDFANGTQKPCEAVAVTLGGSSGSDTDNASVTITFGVTHGMGAIYETPETHILLPQEITVPYFDLALYGLEGYYYNPDCYTGLTQEAGTKETAEGVVTTMHAIIWATEVLYLGLDEAAAGKGYLKDEGLIAVGQDGDDRDEYILFYTGGAGSSYVRMWDHGTNLNYYLNYAYPLGKSQWGSTSDQQELKDGDVVTLHQIVAGEGLAIGGAFFQFFTKDEIQEDDSPADYAVSAIDMKVGDTIQLTAYETVPDYSNYTTNYQVYSDANSGSAWPAYWIDDANFDNVIVEEESGYLGDPKWNAMDTNGTPFEASTAADEFGVLSLKALKPGTYYVATPGRSTDWTQAGPAVVKIVVTGEETSAPETYTVTFDANGHGMAPAAMENVASGSTITAPTAPTAEGWEFGGWYKEAACTNAWDFATDTVTAATTLYAKWTANTYTVTAPAASDAYTFTGETTVAHGEDYTFTVEPQIPYRVTEVKVNGETATGVNRKYTVHAVDEDLTITVATEEVVLKPVTVTFEITEGENGYYTYEKGHVAVPQEVTVPYFDLGLYDLECFYYNPDCYHFVTDGDKNMTANRGTQTAGTAATAYGVVTTMHVFIWTTEVFHCGLDPEEAGKGYLQDMGFLGAMERNEFDTSNYMIYYTGGVGSTFMYFLDHGSNLNYYLNYEYPLGQPGWGSTADQQALQDGDIISAHLISSYDYYSSGYQYLKVTGENGALHETTVTQGETFGLELWRTAAGGNYTTTQNQVVEEWEFLSYVEAEKLTGEILDDNGYPIAPWMDPYSEESDEAMEFILALTGDMFWADAETGVMTIYTEDIAPGSYYLVVSGTGIDGSEYGAAIFKLTVEAKTYTVTAPAVSDTYTFTGAAAATHGEAYTFTVEAAEGYDVTVQVNEQTVTGTDGSYTIENVNNDLIITVTATKKTYAVTLPAGEGYTAIGNATATHGEAYTFTVEAAEGYDVTVQVNDQTVTGTDGSYTVANVTAAPTITITAAKKTFTVTFNANGHGTAPTAMENVAYGSTITAPTAPTAEGWDFGGWYKEAACTNAWDFATDTVTAATTLYAKWTAKTYTVTLPTGTGYAVTGNATATHGESYSFAVEVKDHFDSTEMEVKVNGQTVTGTDGSYTVTNVTGDLTITVSGIQKLHDVTGSVKNHNGTPAANLTVKLVKGSIEEATATTNSNGEYTLEDVHEGTYNLVAAESGNGRTMTAKVEVTAASGDTMTVEPVTMPEANVSSKLEVTKDTPEVVVGGLNELAEQHEDAAKHVTVKMNVAKQKETTAPDEIKTEIDAIEKVINDTSRETVFVTINLEKQADGENTATAITDTGDVLLEIIVPFDLEGKQSVKVYRYHGSAVDELRETVNADGEKIELDREKNQIAIHAKKFSTYAISTSETKDVYPVTVLNGIGSGDYEVNTIVQIQAEVPYGYRFKQWVVIPDTVKLASTTSAATTFVMPETTVTILAEFEKIEVSQKKEETAKKMSFTDVKTSDWFYDEVKYVYEAGIMTGLSAAKFGPNQTTTRGMIVTMLYRLEGSPKVEGMSTFRDVNPNAYFADAIKWAAKNKIVEGYDGKFAPNDAITREQMATILYRYCKYKGYDVSAKGDLSVFTDAAQISDYAKDAMAWAVGIGLYNGRGDGTIVAPQDNATRAEVAAILMRFMERKK